MCKNYFYNTCKFVILSFIGSSQPGESAAFSDGAAVSPFVYFPWVTEALFPVCQWSSPKGKYLKNTRKRRKKTKQKKIVAGFTSY